MFLALISQNSFPLLNLQVCKSPRLEKNRSTTLIQHIEEAKSPNMSLFF